MKQNNGFTLLEVLIALAIIAIAVSALLQSSSQDIDNSRYLQNKTFANRLILNTVNKIQADLVNPPYPPYEHVETATMANLKWIVIAKRFKHSKLMDRIHIEIRLKRRGKPLEQFDYLRRKL